jgi:hypothetical protein
MGFLLIPAAPDSPSAHHPDDFIPDRKGRRLGIGQVRVFQRFTLSSDRLPADLSVSHATRPGGLVAFLMTKES